MSSVTQVTLSIYLNLDYVGIYTIFTNFPLNPQDQTLKGLECPILRLKNFSPYKI